MTKEKNLKYRIDLYLNPDKEQAWFNQMCREGWALEQISWAGLVCRFRACVPEEYQYCIEFVEHSKTTPEGTAYHEFLQEMGIECIFYFAGVAVLRRKNSGEPFQLYSDNVGRLLHLKRKRAIFILLSVLMIFTMLLTLCGLAVGILYGASLPWITANSALLGVYGIFLGFLLNSWRSYSKQIHLLKQDSDQSNEVLPENWKRKRGYSPFLGWSLILMLIGAVAGGIIGALTQIF